MNSTTAAWTITLFFGCSIAFAAIRRWTAGSGVAVTLLAEFALLAIVVGGLVWFVKRGGDGDRPS